MKVICYVKDNTGKSLKFKSKKGENFKDKKGKTYNAPQTTKNEILEIERWWGRKLLAFYKDGQENPIPLDRDTKWREITNHDSDVDMLVKITRIALIENSSADLKQNITLGAIGLILLFLTFRMIWTG